MRSLCVEKIETVLGFVDRDCVLVCVVLEDELFEVEESTLVLHLLTNLNHSTPCVLCRKTRAVWALTILNDKLDLEDLLENRRCEHLLLYCKLDSETLAVWLCPDETCVDESNFIETFELLETNGKQFS